LELLWILELGIWIFHFVTSAATNSETGPDY
jgi:hypothetical protein